MKPQLNFKAIGMISTIVLLVFTTSSLQSLNAQTTATTVVTESKPDLQVKFIGSTGDFLFFEVYMPT